MTGHLDQIDEAVDQRIRAGFSTLRDDVTSSADVESALTAIGTESSRRAWSRPSVRITVVAAAAVVALVVGYAAWPREVVVTTGDGPPRSVDSGPGTSTPPTSPTSSTTPSTTVPPVVPGDTTQYLIVGGTEIPSGRPKRSDMENLTPGSKEPDGSGCSPSGGALPDGVWYGYLAVDHNRLALDLACRFTNDAARWAIRTYEDRRPDSDEERFVLNESAAVRPLPVDSRSWIVDIAHIYPTWQSWQDVTAEQLRQRVEQLGHQARLAAWVQITDGLVVWLDVSMDNYAG